MRRIGCELFYLIHRRFQAVNIALHGKPVQDALGRPDDRVLILVGHDNNLANIAGNLGMNWLEDGRRDDTPPGGALVFELWRNKSTSQYIVRSFYTTQTLDQMRNSVQLSLESPPERVPVILPGCVQSDEACALSGFEQTLNSAIDP